MQYLLIDLRPETDENYWPRAKNLPDDDRQYVYVPNLQKLVQAMEEFIHNESYASAGDPPRT